MTNLTTKLTAAIVIGVCGAMLKALLDTLQVIAQM